MIPSPRQETKATLRDLLKALDEGPGDKRLRWIREKTAWLSGALRRSQPQGLDGSNYLAAREYIDGAVHALQAEEPDLAKVAEKLRRADEIVRP